MLVDLSHFANLRKFVQITVVAVLVYCRRKRKQQAADNATKVVKQQTSYKVVNKVFEEGPTEQGLLLQPKDIPSSLTDGYKQRSKKTAKSSLQKRESKDLEVLLVPSSATVADQPYCKI